MLKPIIILCLHYNYKKILTIFYLCLLTSFSYSSEDINIKKIQINSTYQSINLLTNEITFIGKVKLNYNSIDLYAKKILAIHINDANKKNKLSLIQAYGNPAILYQKPKKFHKTIFAHSLKISFNTHNNLITLNGNSFIKIGHCSIQSDNIIYSINNKKITAFSNPNNQITTILSFKKQ